MDFQASTSFIGFLSAGSGGSGQLLRGDLDDHTTFQPIKPEKLDTKNPQAAGEFLQNLKEISLGGTKAVGLTKQGDLYAWGEDSEKLGEKMQIHIQPILLIPNKVTKISCGWAHNICSTDENQVFVWGEGKFGQLGLGKDQMIYASKPTPISLPTTENFQIIDVVAGFRQTYIVTNQTKIICFGSNKTLELGRETKDSIVASPITVDLQEKGLKNIRKLDAGQRFVVALDQEGELYGWGCNKYGQLGQLPEKKKAHLASRLDIHHKIKDISCGWNHTLVQTEDGEAYITGRGDFGQQGNNKTEDVFGFHRVWLDEKNTPSVKRITSGSEASYVVTQEDEIYVWGWNEHGNLATGDKEDRHAPVKLDFKGKDPQVFCGGAAVIIALR